MNADPRLLLEELLAKRAGGPREHPFAAHVNPHLGRLLRGLGLDKRYVRGSGCWLEDEDGEPHLDFTAAYGALPFGFNPPELWDALHSVEAAQEPSMVQPSYLDAAGELAEALLAVAPPHLRHVTFANSGAEAVEAAIKLARAATGRLGVLATENAFHGKTLGALSATGRARYQQPFGAPAPGFSHVAYGDAEALERTLAARAGELAAFMVEPIQGEGGIVTPPPGYLQRARAACSRAGVLLIADEVQTGLGRTGRLFACEEEGVAPDVITLAKALGGGLVPAAAVLCTADAYSKEFALRHTSTFAGNALACRVGLRVLELLTRDDGALMKSIERNGRRLRAVLEELRLRHPQLVRGVRGRGYLLGVELTGDFRSFSRQSILGSLAEQETLVAVLCGHMLHAHRVRVAPAFFGGRVIRVEPPLVAGPQECDRFLTALGETLEALEACDSPRLLGHLAGRREGGPTAAARSPRGDEPPRPRPDEPRFGFIVHPLDVASYRDLDPGLAELSDAELDRLVDRLQSCRIGAETEAMVVGAARVASVTGATAFGELVCLPYTAEELLALRARDAVASVREAVELARDRGAEIIGLGAYSSIVTRNGLDLAGVGVPLTTGNGFTVAAAVEAVRAAGRDRGPALAEATVAVVGATGSIGRAVALLLAEDAGRLILLGNAARAASSLPRLHALEAEIRHRPRVELAPDRVLASTDLDAHLAEADVVVTCTSAPRPLFAPEALKAGALVCDVSQPSNVARAMTAARPDVLVVEGGIVAVPGRRPLGVSFGLESGLLYACMAETAVLALEGRPADGSLGGDLTVDRIAALQVLAHRHGLRVVCSEARGPEPMVRLGDVR